MNDNCCPDAGLWDPVLQKDPACTHECHKKNPDPTRCQDCGADPKKLSQAEAAEAAAAIAEAAEAAAAIDESAEAVAAIAEAEAALLRLFLADAASEDVEVSMSPCPLCKQNYCRNCCERARLGQCCVEGVIEKHDDGCACYQCTGHVSFANSLEDESKGYCTARPDGVHCDCWWDPDADIDVPCCSCGFDGTTNDIRSCPNDANE